MRAALLLGLLVVAPSVCAAPEEPARDLIVTLRSPMEAPPPGALELALFEGFVLPDATRADAARLLADPRVERVDWAVPLAFSAALPTHAFTELTRAESTGLDGAGVTIAVLDSGIDGAHPDLVGRVAQNVKLVEGRFVPALGDADGHGTHVAGIVAASGSSSQGRWHGVAPAATLVGVDISARFTTASAVLAYDWLDTHRAETGVRIVVNAWGRVGQGEPYDPSDPVMRAIDRLVDHDVVVLFSASNHGPRAGTLSLEAQDPRVITVGATDAAAQLMDYSSRGPVSAARPWTKPDVVAPGDGVVGPRSAQSIPHDGDPDALHTTYSGTSQAVPHVAGIVALMLQQDPSLSPEEIAIALRASAIDLGAPGPDDETGYGLVDAHDALRAARGVAPDRTNVLIAGGTERYQDETAAGVAQRRGLLDILARPDVVWETSFPVLAGAERVRVSATAAGAPSVGVELVKDGHVHGAEVARPEAGVWTARLRASVPVATSARIVVASELPAHPARALQFDGHSGAPAVGEATHEPARLALPLGLLVLAATIGVLLATALWPRKKAPAEAEPGREK